MMFEAIFLGVVFLIWPLALYFIVNFFYRLGVKHNPTIRRKKS